MSQRREGDPLALVLDRLDTMIDLLSFLAGAPPTRALVDILPSLGDAYRQGRTPARQGETTNKLLEYLLAAALPSAPQQVRTITIGTTPVQLASNESQPLMRVDISNLNVAQPLNISKAGVTVLSGMQIQARQTVPFVLPPGAELVGVVGLGTILVTVSEGYDMQPALDQLLRS